MEKNNVCGSLNVHPEATTHPQLDTTLSCISEEEEEESERLITELNHAKITKMQEDIGNGKSETHIILMEDDEEEEKACLLEENDDDKRLKVIFDDFVRFDLSRTGPMCCTGYRISVQYADDYLTGVYKSRRKKKSSEEKGVNNNSHHQSSSNNNNDNNDDSHANNCCLPINFLSTTKSIHFFTTVQFDDDSLLNPNPDEEKEKVPKEEEEEDRESVIVVDDDDVDDEEKVSQLTTKSQILFANPVFQLDYPSALCCFRVHKKRKYGVRISQSRREIGYILSDSRTFGGWAPLEIGVLNSNDDDEDKTDLSLYKCRKIRLNSYWIENKKGEKVGTLDVFRGLRGGISSYGVSTVDDSLSPRTKAVFLASAIAMDVEEREADIKCTCVYTPLGIALVILLFTILPWLYYVSKSLSSPH